jgi:hypothetical protein
MQVFNTDNADHPYDDPYGYIASMSIDTIIFYLAEVSKKRIMPISVLARTHNLSKQAVIDCFKALKILKDRHNEFDFDNENIWLV